ncbi:hypothetical protein CRG98_034054 [Punica granatum]|uniref:Uncharacterized protein n=1 Tax=Punica granatum TaxID=22663 RepID=A0A2I0IQ36_PUNGR|nr:hypothetical protein CRG98_034054 [Punica granatum]
MLGIPLALNREVSTGTTMSGFSPKMILNNSRSTRKSDDSRFGTIGNYWPGTCTYRCAHPNFISSGHAMRAPNATRLGSVHIPGEARRTHVRRSRHLSFYDPKVEGRQVTRV